MKVSVLSDLVHQQTPFNAADRIERRWHHNQFSAPMRLPPEGTRRQ